MGSNPTAAKSFFLLSLIGALILPVSPTLVLFSFHFILHERIRPFALPVSADRDSPIARERPCEYAYMYRYIQIHPQLYTLYTRAPAQRREREGGRRSGRAVEQLRCTYTAPPRGVQTPRWQASGRQAGRRRASSPARGRCIATAVATAPAEITRLHRGSSDSDAFDGPMGCVGTRRRGSHLTSEQERRRGGTSARVAQMASPASRRR